MCISNTLTRIIPRLSILRRHYRKPTRKFIILIILVQSLIVFFSYQHLSDNASFLGRESTRKDDKINNQENNNGNNKESSNIATAWKDKLSILTEPLFKLLPTMNSKDQIQNAAALYKKLYFDSSPNWIDDYYLNSHLLTVPFGKDKNKKFNSVDDLTFYDSDPRLSWSVYLNYIINNFNNEKNDLLPFSWYDWADFHNFNKLISIKQEYFNHFNCDFILKPYFDKDLLVEMESSLDTYLFSPDRDKYNDKFWYRTATKIVTNIGDSNDYCEMLATDPGQNDKLKFNLPFKIIKNFGRLKPEIYQINARSYILNTLNHPLSITFLESSINSYRIPLEQNNRSNMIESRLLHKYIENAPKLKNDDIKFNHLDSYEQFLKSDAAQKFQINIPNLDKNIFNQDSIHLSLDDFMFDMKAKINELKSMDESSLTVHDKSYLESLIYSNNVHPALIKKYFDEARELQGEFGHHRDRRFYNGGKLEKKYYNPSRMNSLIRTFEKFLKSNGIIYWLAHGSLYGHLYNGLTFPWDNDFDIQMPIKHLHILAQNFNQSLILEDPREGNGRYILDVGSSISVRTLANGKNNIDARFIDIDSGLYIDITGLTVSSERYKKDKSDILESVSMQPVVDELSNIDMTLQEYPEKGEGLAALDIWELEKYSEEHPDEFDEEDKKNIREMVYQEEEYKKSTFLSKDLTPKQRYYLHKKLNLVNCRNRHFDTLDMISPLTPTYYHGILTLIPNKVIYSLANEYTVPKRYGFMNFQGKSFIPKLKIWIPFTLTRRIFNLNDVFPNMVKLSSEITRLEFPDVKKVLQNCLIGNYLSVLSYIITSFDVTNYRLKELEISYDTNLDSEQRQKALTILREQVGPTLSSPMKDALLLEYEERLWKQFQNILSSDNVNELKDFSHLDIVEDISKNFALFFSRHWFGKRLPENFNIDFDLDRIGLDLYDDIEKKKNTLMENDPPKNI